MKKGNGSVVGLCVIALMGGVLCLALSDITMGIVLIAVFAASLIYEIKRYDKLRVLFRSLDLGDFAPEHDREKDVYSFKVPYGRGLEDFEKQKSRIQDHLDKDVEFSCSGGRITMKLTERGPEKK